MRQRTLADLALCLVSTTLLLGRPSAGRAEPTVPEQRLAPESVAGVQTKLTAGPALSAGYSGSCPAYERDLATGVGGLCRVL